MTIAKTRSAGHPAGRELTSESDKEPDMTGAHDVGCGHLSAFQLTESGTGAELMGRDPRQKLTRCALDLFFRPVIVRCPGQIGRDWSLLSDAGSLRGR